MIKLLFIAPYPPSLIRVRSYNLIRELSRRGHHVTLATVWTGQDELQDIPSLSTLIARVEKSYLPRWRSYWNCVMALPTRMPLQAVYSWQSQLLKVFGDNLKCDGKNGGFDVVHVEHLRGSKYGLRIKQLNPDLPVVWDSVDCISLLFKLASERSKRLVNRWITSFERSRTREYESYLLGKFDHTVVTSRIDREALLELGGSSDRLSLKVSVLPNGVDLDYFKPDDDQVREPETVVVSGKMSYHANITMVLNLVEQIMPRIWSSRPGVKLWIVGKDPGPMIQSLSKHPGIEVTGTVDDIRPYLRRATVAVSPLTYGVGIQNKVLEAMACRTPVVSTPQAVSTLGATPGEDVLVADRPEEFAAKVLQLIDDPSLQAGVGEAGLRYVRKYHRWSAVAELLEGIYQDAIANNTQVIQYRHST